MFEVKNKVSTKSLFWGSLFIVFGGFLFLHTIEVYTLNHDALHKLWPVIFIIIGINYLVKESIVRVALSLCAGVLGGLILASLVVGKSCWHPDFHFYHGKRHHDMKSSSIHTPMHDSVTTATFHFTSGGGDFEIGDTTSDLVSAEYTLDFGKYAIESSGTNTSPIATLRLDGDSIHIDGVKDNSLAARLNEKPQWNIEIEIGAANLECDFTKHDIASLVFKGGACNAEFTFGEKAKTTSIDIESGVSNIEVRIPHDAGLEIHSDGGLSSEEFPDDVVETSARVYRSKNFDSAGQKITINLSVGVSNVEISRL